MALVKRGKTWHCHFVVNGQRFRQSLGTKDWREAQANEKQLIAEASERKLTHTPLPSPASPLHKQQTITQVPESWSLHSPAKRKRSSF